MIDNRKLCGAEQAVEILNRLTNSSNVVVSGRIFGLLSEEVVRQGLDLIQDHHARLNSRIVGDLDNLRFETGAKKIPLRVVDKKHEGQWQETLIEELNTKIESSEVLLRAVLVQEQELGENSTSHLIITIHHAIADALSSIHLYSELLSYCSKVASGEPPVPVSRLSALPSIDELFPPSTKGFRGKINILLSLLRFQLKLLLHRPENLGIEKSIPLELRRCGNVYRHLDADFTQQLVNRCRQEKTTVQGALCAAMMLVAARKIRPDRTTRVSCRSYVDLRKYLKPVVSNEHMGTLISGVNSFHTVDTKRSFWELARDVIQQLKVGLKRDDMFIEMLLLRKSTDLMISRASQVPLTVGLSNVGQVNIPKVYGKFELSEISFVPSQATVEGYVLASVTTFEGNMFLHFPFSVPAISQETMETFVDKVLSCLVDATKVKV
ncbi:MAG: alcohol acetyltransferase [Okeania sp. SIO2C2]|nr:alcohol acetyltransferase [Okeania sp. SIO2C2]